jgi:heptosyltransferase-1
VLPWGSDSERARCERIVARSGSGIVPRAMSLSELASLMAGARAVFGVDTGLAHLAAALGTGSIGLFCSTDPTLTGLYGGSNAVNIGRPGHAPTPGEAIAAMEAMG